MQQNYKKYTLQMKNTCQSSLDIWKFEIMLHTKSLENRYIRIRIVKEFIRSCRYFSTK